MSSASMGVPCSLVTAVVLLFWWYGFACGLVLQFAHDPVNHCNSGSCKQLQYHVCPLTHGLTAAEHALQPGSEWRVTWRSGSLKAGLKPWQMMWLPTVADDLVPGNVVQVSGATAWRRPCQCGTLRSRQQTAPMLGMRLWSQTNTAPEQLLQPSVCCLARVTACSRHTSVVANVCLVSTGDSCLAQCAHNLVLLKLTTNAYLWVACSSMLLV